VSREGRRVNYVVVNILKGEEKKKSYNVGKHQEVVVLEVEVSQT
jgi:hypothetical protein